MVKNWKKIITIILTIFMVFSTFKIINVEAFNIKSITDSNIKVVKVGVHNWEGFSGTNNKVFFQNYVTDYFEKLTKATGIKFEYVNGSWNEIMKKLDDGEVNAVFGALYTKNRSRKYAYIKNEVYSKNIDIITLKKAGEKNNANVRINFFQVPGKVFGVINKEKDYYKEKEYYKELLEQNISKNDKAEINYYESNKGVLKALKNNEIDYIINNDFIDVDNDSELKKASILTQAKYYLITNKKEEELINVLTKGALEIQKNAAILNKNLIAKNRVVLNLNEARTLENIPILTFYVAKDNYFYYKKHQDGSETGIYAWYMKQISKILHKDYEVIPIDPNDLALQKKTGFYFDMLRSYKYIPNRYASKELSNATMKTQALFVVKNQASVFGETKKGLIYASCDPGYLSMYAKNNAQRILTKNDEESLKLLADNKANVAVLSYFSSYYLNSMARYKKVSLAGIEGNISRALLIVNSKDPNLMGVINKAIESISDSEFRTNIAKETKNYIYHPTISEQLKNNYALFISLIAIILVISFFVIRILINKNKEIEGLTKSVSKANSVKDDFLSRISHDMRTPLNAIISYSDFGIEETKNSNNKDYFINIKENSSNLLNLMKDVLELQRINNLGNRVENIRKIISLKESLDSLNDTCFSLAKQKDIKFIFKEKLSENNIKYIKGNKVLLTQALFNVLANAIKYTQAGGRVEWSIEGVKFGENLRLKNVIHDNGPGISPDFQKIMFDAFSVSNNTLTNNSQGTGLGLAISKNAVDTLGGTIKCKSGVGFGTTFIITVPVGKVLESEIKEYEEKCAKKKKELEKMDKNHLNLMDIKVLLCEDQVINAKIIEKILSKNKIEITWAKNGSEGLELFKKIVMI